MLIVLTSWFRSGRSSVDAFLNSGEDLTLLSDICNRCFMEGYNNKARIPPDARPTTKELLEHLRPRAAEKKHQAAAAFHEAMLSVLRILQESVPVAVEDAIEIVAAKRRECGLSVPVEGVQKDKGLRQIAVDILTSVGNGVTDAYYVSYEGHEIGVDGRTLVHFVMPKVISHKYVVCTDRKVRQLETVAEKVRQESQMSDGPGDADGTPTAAGGASSADGEKAKLESTRAAGQDVCESIKAWGPWSGETWASTFDLRKTQELEVDVVPPVEYLKTFCPPQLFTLLMAVCGWKEDRFDEQEGRDKMSRQERGDAGLMYFLATMIGRAVMRTKFMPPHFLKLSQALKQWGVGQKPMSLLASLNICYGDWVRWDRENCLPTVNDKDLMPKGGQMMCAYDNTDVKAEKMFDGGKYIAFLAATAHVAKGGGAVLGPESSWLPETELTVELVRYGPDKAAHDRVVDEWMQTLWDVLEGSSEYLSTPGPGQSCLEVELQKVTSPAVQNMENRTAFIQRGSSKSTQDNAAAIERIRVQAGVLSRKEKAEGVIPDAAQRVAIEGDQETFAIMIKVPLEEEEEEEEEKEGEREEAQHMCYSLNLKEKAISTIVLRSLCSQVTHEGMRARVRTDDGQYSEYFDVGQGLRPGSNPASLLFNLLFSDDAAIVSRSPESLEKVVSVIVRVVGRFGLMVSEPKTEIMCMLPKGIEERPFTVSAAGQTYKQRDRFVYLGRTISADGKADREITSRSCRAWKCYRRNSASMYDRRRADRQLKIRLPQAETALSYAQALIIQADCEETIKATVRKQRLCFAGFVMRMEDNRLPKRMLLGAMAGGGGYRGGQESDWVSRLGEELVAFNMGDEKERGKWKESAKDPEVWYNKVEDGAAWFMRKWLRQEAKASAKRQRAKEAEAESTAISGPKG
ncbi:unnamed protein product [Ectocarpus sp. CCAP 1310/34]|nr:unnamed protein product [Ectocarpus sp. CCAP 1310/34]